MKYVMQNKYMKGVITVYLDSDTELNNCKKVWLCNFQIVKMLSTLSEKNTYKDNLTFVDLYNTDDV